MFHIVRTLIILTLIFPTGFAISCYLCIRNPEVVNESGCNAQTIRIEKCDTGEICFGPAAINITIPQHLSPFSADNDIATQNDDVDSRGCEQESMCKDTATNQCCSEDLCNDYMLDIPTPRNGSNVVVKDGMIPSLIIFSFVLFFSLFH